MKLLFAARRRAVAVGAYALVAVVAAAGLSFAAVSTDGDLYSGCLQNGLLTNIAIGSTPFKACSKNASQISWSQTGPPGTNGINGTNGTNGINGTNGADGVDGRDGVDGTDGVSVTSVSEAAGPNCLTGGTQFTAASGAVTYACNGQKGDKGDPGIQGEKGDPGAAAPSLDGIPCETGSLDRPDGQTKVAVAPTTGLITLTCVSASTNPTLNVSLRNLSVGTSVVGYLGVSEVDANGVPVPQGFVCQRSNLAFFACTTQRFAPGSTVHLKTGGLTGWLASWTGCDSVSADRLTCTVVLPATGTAAVSLTPATS